MYIPTTQDEIMYAKSVCIYLCVMSSIYIYVILNTTFFLSLSTFISLLFTVTHNFHFSPCRYYCYLWTRNSLMHCKSSVFALLTFQLHFFFFPNSIHMLLLVRRFLSSSWFIKIVIVLILARIWLIVSSFS